MPKTIALKKKFSLIPQTLLVLFGFLLPTQFGKHFFLPFSYLSGIRIDYLAPTVYAIDVLVVILAISHRSRLRKTLQNVYLQLLLFIVSTTLWFSYSREVALYQYVRLLEMIVIFSVVRSERLNGWLIQLGLTCSMVLELILSVGQVVTKSSVNGPFYYLGERTFSLSTVGIAKVSMSGVEMMRAYGTFSHPNSMGGFYLLMYAYVLFSSQRSWTRTLTLSVAPLLIFLSFSKVAMLGFALITLKYFVVHNFFTEERCLVCIGAKLLSLLIPVAIVLRAVGDPLSAAIRMQLMNNAVLLIQNHLGTGVGLGNYIIAQQFFPTLSIGSFAQPVHNIFLLLLAEIGVIPFLLFLWAAIPFLKQNRTHYQLIACVFIVCFTGLFDHYWITLIQNSALAMTVFGLLETKE